MYTKFLYICLKTQMLKCLKNLYFSETKLLALNRESGKAFWQHRCKITAATSDLNYKMFRLFIQSFFAYALFIQSLFSIHTFHPITF